MNFELTMAEQKFWNSPELMEKLLSMLDPLSILRLVQFRLVKKETLQKSLSYKAWLELIKHSSICSQFYGGLDLDWLKMEDVKDLVKILKLMKLEEPSAYLLPLLDLNCERSPRDEVHMICPCGPEPHLISTDAFMLLEEIEGAFRTTEQSVTSWRNADLEEPFLSALSSRVNRQDHQMAMIFSSEILIENKTNAEDFITLLQADVFVVDVLKVADGMGEEIWQILGQAFQANQRHFNYIDIVTTRKGMAEAKKEDIKEILATFENINFWINLNPFAVDGLLVETSRYDWEGAWTRLKRFSDMTDDEFMAELEEKERRLEEEEESGSDEESEGGEQDGGEEMA